MLNAERIELRALQTEDVWLMYKWQSDRRVVQDMAPQHGPFAPNMEEIRRSLEKAVGSSSERYFIAQAEGGRPIGYASLIRIDQRNSSAELTVVIGEPEEWGKGLGREMTTLLVGYAFSVLNLHRVHLRVAEYNRRAVSCFEACGFRREGTLRDDHYHLGAYRSSHVMSVLRDEGSG